MSRSRRTTPIFGYSTAESDKRFKTTEHRRERRAVRSLDLISADLPPPRAFGNPATSAKDGKHYWAGAKPKDLRK